MNTRLRSIYLSGPMTGLPKHNLSTFAEVTAQLRADGHHVYNPGEFNWRGKKTGAPFPIREAFAEYSAFICIRACTIVLLPGWEASLGVSAELALAKNVGLDILEWKDWSHRRLTE